MIEPDFLDELERFDSELKRKVNSIFQGEQKSPHVGEGLTFSDHRQYYPGDDTRLIDWKLYARTDDLYIKQFEEERNLTVHILLDASKSMEFGEGNKNKFEYAAKIGLGYAYLTIAENNDFRFSVFADQFQRIDTGASNRGEILRIIDTLNERDLDTETNFRSSLQNYSSQIRSKSLVLIVSDFIGEKEAIRDGIRSLSNNYVVLGHIIAPEELDLPASGDTIFEEIEQGFELRTYLSNRIKNEYKKRIQDHIDTIERYAEDYKADHILINTGQEFFDSFSDVWIE